jgi:hypothetical protein
MTQSVEDCVVWPVLLRPDLEDVMLIMVLLQCVVQALSQFLGSLKQRGKSVCGTFFKQFPKFLPVFVRITKNVASDQNLKYIENLVRNAISPQTSHIHIIYILHSL